MRRTRPYLRPIAADPDLEPVSAHREVVPDGAAPAVRDAETGGVLPAPASPPPGAGPGRRDGCAACEPPAGLLAATS